MNAEFVAKLSRFNDSLTEAEKANYKLLLGLAAGNLVPGFDETPTSADASAFHTVSDALSRLQPYKDQIPADGVAYVGRPAFMTDALLGRLQREARETRPLAQKLEEHYLGTGAPFANQFAVSDELTSFVSSNAGTVLPTGIASFLFYDEPGLGIDPHVDTDIFSLNTLLMLDHTHGEGEPSRLVLFPPYMEPKEYALAPGDMIVFYAGTIAHGRHRMKPGESVTILTFGFHPLGL